MSRKDYVPFWKEFIRMYRNLPVLWDVQSKDYNNNQLKEAAYEKLMYKLREIDKFADKDSVRRKIFSLLERYTLKLKKEKDWKKLGTRSLAIDAWPYSKDMEFLKTQMLIRLEKDQTQSDCITEDSAERCYGTYSTESAARCQEASRSAPKPKAPARNKPKTAAIRLAAKRPAAKNKKTAGKRMKRNSAENNVSLGEEDAEKLAQYWAMEYMKLSDDQKILAKREISDVLCDGQMGDLR